MKYLIIVISLIFSSQLANSQIANYQKLQEKICTGWNTWSNGSMLSHVLLPEGLAMKINLRQSFIGKPGDPKFFLHDFIPDSSRLVRPIAHTFDGSYTELLIDNWKGNTIRVQSAAKGNEIMILVTPVVSSPNIHYSVELEAGIMWNREGTVRCIDNTITATFKDAKYIIRSTAKNTATYHPYTSPYLTFKGDSAIGFYTGKVKSLDEIKATIEHAKQDYYSYSQKYGDLAEGFRCMQSILGWNTIYDAEKNRAITPVTRSWNEAWQGYVLFEWDTYFASLLFSLDNKNLAYSNAIAMTKGLNKDGYVGQWQMPGQVATGISQPPIGSMVCWMIYEKYGDKWFLEEVYNELLSWNRWWIKNRANSDFLTWGCEKGNVPLMAALESGLDNAPMYEDVKMVEIGNNSLYNIADVGLNSIYVADCKYLAKIAGLLGKTTDETELLSRAETYNNLTQKLWDAKTGIYLNKFLDKPGFSQRLSPTLFYPMLAGIPSKEQADRMIKDHFFNPNEFYGKYMLPSCAFNDKSYNNDYWRGAIWGPMNLLVYLGLRDYDPKAATELADKSYHLFIDAWEKHGAVFENINSEKGVENRRDQLNSDPYYHWGALMGIMKFMEEGKCKSAKSDKK